MTRSKAIRFVGFVRQYRADNPDATPKQVADAYIAAHYPAGTPLITPDTASLKRLAELDDRADHQTVGRPGI